jgi:hypothetical protein
MQTKNDKTKPETELKQETGEGCSGATCSAFNQFMAGALIFHVALSCLIWTSAQPTEQLVCAVVIGVVGSFVHRLGVALLDDSLPNSVIERPVGFGGC